MIAGPDLRKLEHRYPERILLRYQQARTGAVALLSFPLDRAAALAVHLRVPEAHGCTVVNHGAPDEVSA